MLNLKWVYVPEVFILIKTKFNFVLSELALEEYQSENSKESFLSKMGFPIVKTVKMSANSNLFINNTLVNKTI